MATLNGNKISSDDVAPALIGNMLFRVYQNGAKRLMLSLTNYEATMLSNEARNQRLSGVGAYILKTFRDACRTAGIDNINEGFTWNQSSLTFHKSLTDRRR